MVTSLSSLLFLYALLQTINCWANSVQRASVECLDYGMNVRYQTDGLNIIKLPATRQVGQP